MRTGFETNYKGGLCYLTIDSFARTGRVRHGFSTRLGGVSEGEFFALNLGPNRGDEHWKVRRNFDLFCEAIEVDADRLVFSKQVHSDGIYHVTSDDIGRGLYKKSELQSADALICNEPGIPLVTFFADCVPLFFLEPEARVIALTHSGWRGTAKKIAAKTVEVMTSHFGCRPDQILAAVGPSIGPCCYEVDKVVAGEFEGAYNDRANELLAPKGGDKYMLDLWRANLIQLEEAGVLDCNITAANRCTCCESDIFFSHRASQGRRGSLCAVMELLEREETR